MQTLILKLSYRNQILLAYLKKLLYLCVVESARVKEIDKNNALRERCSFLYYRRCDVLGFSEIEFLTDLGLALVDSLETLTGEHVDFLCGEIRFEQTA